MPPKKRALEETDRNAQHPPSKRSSTGKAAAVGSDKEQQPGEGNRVGGSQQTSPSPDDLVNKPDDEYVCMNRPLFDIVEQLHHEELHADENEDEDDVDLEQKARELHSQPFNRLWPKPAADHPDWKWTIVWEAWKMLCELYIKKTHVCPDNFDMHVFSDFYGFGIHSLVEQRMAAFSKEWNKKTNRSLQRMWAIMASLGHWLAAANVTEPWLGIEDGDGVRACISLVGNALLSVLEVMDLEGQLKSDSKYRDLGLVMSLHLEWSKGLVDYGIDEEDLEWRRSVVAYAEKAGIDLFATGCCSVAFILEEDELQDVEPIAGNADANRWDWKKNFAKYKREHGVDEVPHAMVSSYDITKWSRAERAKHNYDGVDPLKDIPAKAIKEGNVWLSDQ